MNDIRQLAELAKIHFTSEELSRMEDDLRPLFALIDTVRDASVPRGDLPEAVPLSALREDTPSPSLPREVLLAQHPGKPGSFFTIPKVV